MKRLQQHPALCGALAAMALGGIAAFADSSLFPNGEPNWSALRIASSHSVASETSALEARYRTMGISEGIGMRSDKFNAIIVIIR